MRAAFYGRTDIVRLLLNAGADAQATDNLGLTAAEWAVRRGFDDITRLLRDPAAASEPLPSPGEVSGEEWTETAEHGRRKDAGDAGRGTAGAEAYERAVDEPGRGVDEGRREPAEAPRGSDELARIKAREELHRRAAESRRRVEEAARSKFEKKEARPSPEDKAPGGASTSADTAIAPPARIQRCPECGTTYRSDLLTYCVYDSARLVSEGEFSPGGAMEARATAWSPSAVRPQVLGLVVLVLIAGSLLGYFINKSISTGLSPGTTAPAQQETVRVPQDRPVTGGSLKGKEITLPEPEHTAAIKSEGITGRVTVAVTVNERGDVISARARSGHPLLQTAAEKAARAAKFSTEKQTRRGAKRSGIITYDFK